MIGALKTPAIGVRMLRNVTPSTTSGVPASSLDSYGAFAGEQYRSSINWSQKRFLRCVPPSHISGSTTVNVNAQFAVNEIEKRHKRLSEYPEYGNKFPDMKRTSTKENYRRSIRGHQSYLLATLSDSKENQNNQLIGEIFKIVIENGLPTVRVKSNEDHNLVKEWVGIQNELQIIKQDRVEEDKRRLQIAKQQVLREMEASLGKGMNLEDLDEAIEGALCSELKDQ